jgi:hypothetical protein
MREDGDIIVFAGLGATRPTSARHHVTTTNKLDDEHRSFPILDPFLADNELHLRLILVIA